MSDQPQDQPSNRRRFQFSLRTLMIVVTLLSIAAIVFSKIVRSFEEDGFDGSRVALSLVLFASVGAAIGASAKRPFIGTAIGLILWYWMWITMPVIHS
jgi:hypothetical protein